MSDLTPDQPTERPAERSLTAAVLDDALPRAESALVLGPVPDDVRELVGTRTREAVWVDPLGPADASPRLDEVVASGQRYDLVLCLAGLDAVAEPVDALSWSARLDQVVGLLEPGGTLVLRVDNDAPLSALTLDVSRQGWARADEDPTRPVGVTQLDVRLRAARLPVSTVHALLGPADAPVAAVDTAALATARDGSVPAQLVEDALTRIAEEQSDRDEQSGGERVPDLVAASARSGELPALADAWLAVVGGRPRTGYWLDRDGVVLWVDQAGPGQPFVVGGQPAGAARLPQEIPDDVTVERALHRAIARGDDAEFRRLAEGFGGWVRNSASAQKALDLRLDTVRVAAGGSFSRGLTQADPSATPEPDTRLVHAWRRFEERLQAAGRETLWPASLRGEERVRLWLGMSGVEQVPEPVTIDAGEASADGDDATAAAAGLPAEVEEELAHLRARVEMLTATLAARDDQLQVREKAIRSLRDQARGAARNRDKAMARTREIQQSSTYRTANQLRRLTLLRHPDALARGIMRRLDSKVRAVRRTR